MKKYDNKFSPYFFPARYVIDVAFVKQDIYEKENDSSTSTLMAEIKENIYRGCLKINVTHNLDDSPMLYNTIYCRPLLGG